MRDRFDTSVVPAKTDRRVAAAGAVTRTATESDATSAPAPDAVLDHAAALHPRPVLDHAGAVELHAVFCPGGRLLHRRRDR